MLRNTAKIARDNKRCHMYRSMKLVLALFTNHASVGNFHKRLIFTRLIIINKQGISIANEHFHFQHDCSSTVSIYPCSTCPQLPSNDSELQRCIESLVSQTWCFKKGSPIACFQVGLTFGLTLTCNFGLTKVRTGDVTAFCAAPQRTPKPTRCISLKFPWNVYPSILCSRSYFKSSISATLH